MKMCTQPTKSYQPKKLTPRHYAIMRDLVSGVPVGALAKIHGYTVSRISIIINSPRFVQEMQLMQQEVKDRFVEVEGNRPNTMQQSRNFIEAEALNSAKVLVELRDNAQQEAVALKASTEILDRAGVTKMERVEVHGQMDVSDALIFALGLEKKDGSSAVKSN